MWKALRERVEREKLKSFREVQDDWIKLMWTLDAYKSRGVPPIGMGVPTDDHKARLDGVYRAKGNWFATLLSLLLGNRTGQNVAARTKVQGFSQLHQIDVAWPDREVDPLVCIETKVTGGPAYGKTPARGAMSDFSNRRKELKFAATDLKLWHRQQDTAIKHWGEWRADAKPRTYFLWAARLRSGKKGRAGEGLDRLIRETDALVRTYLDGAGIFAWRTNEAEAAYEVVNVPASANVSALDDVLYRIETVIAKMSPDGRVPAAQVPAKTAVDVTALEPEREKPD